MTAVQDARVALLARLIDHAPTFPPASLALPEAVAEDERAHASASAFMLGRFVSPASRLEELPDVGRGVSVVLDAPLGSTVRVEALELPPGADLDAISGDGREVYVEVPLDDDLESRLEEISTRGLCAKVRCAGGPPALGRFLLECRARGIAYKATAGLHHAFRTNGEYGFLNVLAAAVFGDEDALRDEDRERFELTAQGFRWGSRVASAEDVAWARRERLRSIGSCSFFEPVEELEQLGVLPL